MIFSESYLESAQLEFERYKTYGDKVFGQLSQEELFWQPSITDNSIAIIIKHVSGNMLSRWTNFLSQDGEKSWRNRDDEFENPPKTKQELLDLWEKGWTCLFDALDSINSSNFDAPIKIRGQQHTIPQAINRQLAHYASHVGQIVFIGKMIKKNDWVSLTIAKGQSKTFNQKMFGKNS
jgi:hypothetical protein